MKNLLLLAVLALNAVCLAQGVNVEITNINNDNFPGIHIFARVTNDTGGFIEDLGANNFEIRENGVLITSFDVVVEWGYMSASLVMDESGSMSGFSTQVISSCNFFVNGMNDLDKGAVIIFNTTAAVAQAMTYNKQLLLNAIATYSPTGNTDLWDAIYLGIQECALEPEKKAVITFTDGQDNQAGVSAAQLPGFAGTDITLYTIGIGNNIPEDSLIYIAEQTGGFYLHITEVSQMQTVLDDIREDICNLYDIYYNSPVPQPNGSNRALEVVCEYGGEVGWDTASYTAPSISPPTIVLSPQTEAILGVSQPAGQALNLYCRISSADTISSARIYYKNVSTQYFTQANLVHGTGVNYSYTIVASQVTAPGIVFYFQATDDEGNTVTLPGYQPGYLSYCIPILTNYAPNIIYNPPAVWLDRRTMEVEANITDVTTGVSQVSLLYRIPGQFFYYESPMIPSGNNMYSSFIEGPELNEEDDLQMFIAAWDNYGVIKYWPSGNTTYVLQIVPELPPTYPAVAIEPVTLPVVIPAAGGSFEYTLFYINPISDSANCDVWTDVVSPSGTVQYDSLHLENMGLNGGQTYTVNYFQPIASSLPSGQYIFRAHTGDFTARYSYFTASFPFLKSATFLEEDPLLRPHEIELETPYLSSGYPNPFNKSVKIDFYIPSEGRVKISIHNISGEEIALLSDEMYVKGSYSVLWNADNLSSGIFFCRMVTEDAVLTSKLLLIK